MHRLGCFATCHGFWDWAYLYIGERAGTFAHDRQ